ncbi:hypothetical protein Tco_0471520 [Tanacetum coccineum]|uniref:Uncharacterized protein n=1 Tax=Tanacetum coccineum TaxID=301880 RepID=A0ABQ4XI21_9ASTR
MIQPEPEDLPKDNPKLEIAVLRSNGAFQDNGKSMKHDGARHKIARWQKTNKRQRQRLKGQDQQSMKEQAYKQITKAKAPEHSSLNDKSNLTDLMKECHQ